MGIFSICLNPFFATVVKYMQRVKIHTEQIEQSPDIVMIRIDGPLDTVAAYEFQEHMEHLVETGVYKFIMNLETLEYISSAGIGVFPGIAQTLHEHEGGLVFIHVSSKIAKLFAMIGLTTIFTIHANKEEALKEFVPG